MNFEEIIKNLNDEIQSLKAALIISEKRCEQYAQAYDQMHDQLKELIRIVSVKNRTYILI